MNGNVDYLVREIWGEGKTTLYRNYFCSLSSQETNFYLTIERDGARSDFSAKNRETFHSVADLRRLSEDKTKSTKITLFAASYG